MKPIMRFLRRDDGPTSVEYAVVMGLVCVVVIAGFSQLGQAVNNTISNPAILGASVAPVNVGVLSGNANPGDGVIIVFANGSMPNTFPFFASIDTEIVQVTGTGAPGTFTVNRAQQSTVASGHAMGTTVFMLP